MITVLIPTFRRPDMLREALRSIMAQTARAEIAKVLVSENSEDNRSAEVVAEFPELPIEYVQRRPPLPPIEHGRALFQPRWPTEFVAVLHDDDWWRPEHLEQALRTLRQDETTALYVAAAFTVNGPISRLACDSNLFAWTGAGFPPFEQRWKLGLPETLLACLLGTPSYYSAMVVRSAALHAAAAVLERDNPFDTDRLLIAALGAEGGIIYQPLPAICIRRHPGQDVRTYDEGMRWLKYYNVTNEFIVELATARGIDLRSLLESRLAECPAADKNKLLRDLSKPWCLPFLREKGLAPEVLLEYERAELHPRRTWKDLAKELIPPALLKVSRRIRPPPGDQGQTAKNESKGAPRTSAS